MTEQDGVSVQVGDEQDGHRVVVVGPGGMATELPPQQGGDRAPEVDARPASITDLVEQPAKVMRIGSMIKQLLEEVRAAPLDEASRARLRGIHSSSIAELEAGLAPELVEELRRITLPFSEDEVPSESELRVAQAQLVGWLEGLFHGIQTALFAQQVAARAQFEDLRRRSLPPGSMPDLQGGGSGAVAGMAGDGPQGPTGQYL